MKIVNTHQIFTDQKVLTGALSKSNEIVLLLESGDVVRVDTETEEKKQLFSVKTSIQFSDGGFDLADHSFIYTLDDVVVLVNEYKTHGFIHHPGFYDSLRIQRGKYQAAHTAYPIALYKDELGIPHIIFASDWNEVQIMNLDTRQVLTAAKSLIAENAEQDHLDFYSKFPEDNKQPWPKEYDYFYGKLLCSPDRLNFLSAGWVWGSSDAYRIYNINNFIQNTRIQDNTIDYWDHDGRGVCWVDNTTIAVTYSRFVAGEADANENDSEIHLYKITDEEVKLNRKIKIKNLNIASSVIHFDRQTSSFIVYDNKIGKLGVAILSLDGRVGFQDKELKADTYYPEMRRFIQVADKTVRIFEIQD